MPVGAAQDMQKSLRSAHREQPRERGLVCATCCAPPPPLPTPHPRPGGHLACPTCSAALGGALLVPPAVLPTPIPISPAPRGHVACPTCSAAPRGTWPVPPAALPPRACHRLSCPRGISGQPCACGQGCRCLAGSRPPTGSSGPPHLAGGCPQPTSRVPQPRASWEKPLRERRGQGAPGAGCPESWTTIPSGDSLSAS